MIFDYSEIDYTDLKSKILKEYLPIKHEHEDAIVFFQVGGFFETYFSDAKTMSITTGIRLSTRYFSEVGSVAMAGVPRESLETYIKKLLAQDFKVCQCCEAIDELGKISRKLVRVYTCGTILENELLDCSENNFIMSLYKYDKDDYKLVFGDVSTGRFYKTRGNREVVNHEIAKVSPNELLISQNQKEEFANFIKKYNTTILKDDLFDENIENSILRYCEKTQKDFLVEFDKIIEYTPQTYMFLDEFTRRNLELTRTQYSFKNKGSLIWFLNHTKTPMGIRCLKKCISEPLISISEISKRQDSIEELIKNKDIIDDIDEILINFSDLSRICAKISNSTICPLDLYSLAINAEYITKLGAILQKFKSPLLKINSNTCSKVHTLIDNVKRAIKKDAPNNAKEGGIINDGYDSNLDFLRLRLSQAKEQIEQYQNAQARRTDIKNLEIKYMKSVGFYIEIPVKYKFNVPDEYLMKNTTKTLLRFTTPTLQEYEDAFLSLRTKINNLEHDIYCKIRKNSLEFLDILRSASHEIAKIDVLLSFAHCAIEHNLVRPVFGDDGIFIKNGYHPSLLKLKNELVKNDTELPNGIMMILTGANMSGKSTYLKYNAIICLLAQIGAYVPAQVARLTILDKIFFRQGTTDDIINNNSSFMVEMNDLKYIIDNVTNTSLILLDEPAKSTNAREGGAIARAFCEYILKKYNSIKAIIATHNNELTKIQDLFPKKAINYMMNNVDGKNSRHIDKGISIQSFAIDVASLAELPDEIIESSKNYF